MKSSNNRFPQTSRTFWRIEAVFRRTVFCNSVIWVSVSVSFNQYLNFMGVFPRTPITSGITLRSCPISFSTLVPNLCNVLFFLIFWYPLFHQKGNWNLLYGKKYPHVPQWHLVLSHIFYDSCVQWSSIVSCICHFPSLPPPCARTTFLSLLSHIFYIFPNRTLFQTNHVVFCTPFEQSCYIHLTHDLHSFQLFHIFYSYGFLGSCQTLLICYWFL